MATFRQALYFTAPRQLEVRQEALPDLPAGHVLVQTLCSAISPGTEMLLYRGQMPTGMAADTTIAALTGDLAYPLKYGYAAVGQVVKLGADVPAGWQGRLVFAFQPHESYFVARPEHLLPLPPGMEPETAVFLPNMETAVSFVMDAQPMIGEQVAVLGQGIVGLLTTALLAQFPLARLLAIDPYPLRREWARRLGAHLALPPDDATLRAALQGQSPYAGADLTLELSGNPQALNLAIELTGYNGRILIGSWYGQKQAPLNLGGHFHRSQMRLISSQVSHIAPPWRGRWEKARRFQVAWRMLAQVQPARLITHRFPLTEAAAAYALLDREPETAVQLLFTYQGIG